MNEDIELAIVALYDEHIAKAGGEAVKTASAKRAIHPAVVDLIADGIDRDLVADMLTDRVVTPKRQQRARTIKKSLDALLDGFPEGGGYVDDVLNQAFPLGDDAGHDKPLRYWREQDFINLTLTRFRGAADTMRAAEELDQTVQRVVARMFGASSVGDVDWRAEAKA